MRMGGLAPLPTTFRAAAKEDHMVSIFRSLVQSEVLCRLLLETGSKLGRYFE